jgi:ABC-type glycerol-3-phosphate transport system substrate-binding protein
MIGNWLLGVPSNVAPNRAIDAEKLVLWLLQNQGQVAGIIDPPTRVSVFNQLASSPGADYFLVIRDALSRSTPRDRTPYWPQLENAVSDSVSGYLAGRFNIDEAADLLDSRIQGIYPKH